jgi:hypothetical protein
MKLKHSAVKSSVFELVSTIEFDLEVGGHFLPTRVELFQDTERKGHWRCRLWERELYHLALTVPFGGRTKKRAESDEELLVERTWELSNRFEDFEARSAKAATKIFMECLKKYLKRVAG